VSLGKVDDDSLKKSNEMLSENWKVVHVTNCEKVMCVAWCIQGRLFLAPCRANIYWFSFWC
jgi:hypothetical protein